MHPEPFTQCDAHSGYCLGSFRMEWCVEDLRAASPFEVAAETKLDLRSVERRGGQMAAERIDVKHGEGMAGNLDHVIDPLTETFEGRKFVDALDAGSLRHCGVV